ncbi:hypothetical protein FACS18949_04000 [Clostridia bacterium]|nr:hypothetical protein FACS18949_04000 [Clostridia bacterium]
MEDELMTDFAACMGQKMLDPLAILSMTLSQMETGEQSEEERLQSIAYARKAYSQLCQMSRIQTALADADISAFEPEPYDAASYLRAVTAQANALTKGNRFTLKCEYAMLSCVMPPAYLRRVALMLFVMGTELEGDVEMELDSSASRLYLRSKVPDIDLPPIIKPGRRMENMELWYEWVRRGMLANMLSPYGGELSVKGGVVEVSFPRGGDNGDAVLRSPEPSPDSDDRVWLANLLTPEDFKSI